jgi:quercetin dioxygenase-like cupin family protein
MSRDTLITSAILGVLGAVSLATLEAQPASPSPKQDVVLKQDMTIPGREALMVEVVLPPGVAEGRHTHPAEVFGFVVSGRIDSEVEGKTTTLKAGDHFYFAPEPVHQNMNKSSEPATTYVVFVAEKGKPLTTKVQ